MPGSHLRISDQAERSRQGAARDDAKAARRTVAVVDSDLSVRRALSRLLRAFGFAVESYGAGRDYLESGDRGAVACLIVDLFLEDMSGVELYERLAGKTAAPPLILMAVRQTSHTETLARRCGAVAFFGKPFEATALLAAVDKAISGEPGEADRYLLR